MRYNAGVLAWLASRSQYKLVNRGSLWKWLAIYHPDLVSSVLAILPTRRRSSLVAPCYPRPRSLFASCSYLLMRATVSKAVSPVNSKPSRGVVPAASAPAPIVVPVVQRPQSKSTPLSPVVRSAPLAARAADRVDLDEECVVMADTVSLVYVSQYVYMVCQTN